MLPPRRLHQRFIDSCTTPKAFTREMSTERSMQRLAESRGIPWATEVHISAPAGTVRTGAQRGRHTWTEQLNCRPLSSWDTEESLSTPQIYHQPMEAPGPSPHFAATPARDGLSFETSNTALFHVTHAYQRVMLTLPCCSITRERRSNYLHKGTRRDGHQNPSGMLILRVLMRTCCGLVS